MCHGARVEVRGVHVFYLVSCKELFSSVYTRLSHELPEFLLSPPPSSPQDSWVPAVLIPHLALHAGSEDSKSSPHTSVASTLLSACSSLSGFLGLCEIPAWRDSQKLRLFP